MCFLSVLKGNWDKITIIVYNSTVCDNSRNMAIYTVFYNLKVIILNVNKEKKYFNKKKKISNYGI